MFLQSNLDKLIHPMEELNLTFEELPEKSEVPLITLYFSIKDSF